MNVGDGTPIIALKQCRCSVLSSTTWAWFLGESQASTVEAKSLKNSIVVLMDGAPDDMISDGSIDKSGDSTQGW